MDFLLVSRIAAIIGLSFGILGILFRLNDIMNRPAKIDRSRSQGSAWRGILFAFTLGMAPWEKESTRIHWIAYLRGILFHIGIFTSFAVLFASPWLGRLPELVLWIGMFITGAGAMAGFAGIAMRQMEANLRALSLPDDYFSVFLTSLFETLAFLALLSPAWLPFFYLETAVLLVYLPFSKIRHCVYFFYAKFFIGKGFGHRGVIGQPKNKFAE